MIQVADRLWVGDSHDAQTADVDCILNVAKDLRCFRGWPTHEYAQVGLVDGPGNGLGQYIAAAFTLHAMMQIGKRVLVHCHEGKSRSMAVALMYLHLYNSRGWNSNLTAIRERVDTNVPDPHDAHRVAFDRIEWTLLQYAIEDK